jgi:hypothetical protein
LIQILIVFQQKEEKKSFLNALFINEEDLSGGGKKEKFRSF